MTNPDANRFGLAVEAVDAVFALAARYALSEGTLEIVNISHQYNALRRVDQGLLQSTLQALNKLATSLSAPDVAITLTGISDSMLAQTPAPI